MFAFIDKTWLSNKRYKQFGRRKQSWPVVFKVVQKMNKLAFDPYYASILIAMAQDARSSTSDTEFQVGRLCQSRVVEVL
jgi:hypothetical protein